MEASVASPLAADMITDLAELMSAVAFTDPAVAVNVTVPAPPRMAPDTFMLAALDVSVTPAVAEIAPLLLMLPGAARVTSPLVALMVLATFIVPVAELVPVDLSVTTPPLTAPDVARLPGDVTVTALPVAEVMFSVLAS